MRLFNRPPSRDPSYIDAALNHFCEEVKDALGTNLEAIVLYGSLVKSGELETEFDHVNVMVVLQRTDYEILDRCVPAVAKAEKEIPLSLMVLTREDLRSSCDVFPIKFHAMQLHHEVLFGDDVLSDLNIPDDHLRLRCEQQLKNLMLRMRSVYLHRSQSEHQLAGTLQAVVRDLLLDLHACLYLKTGFVPEADADMATLFGSEFNLDASVIGEISELSESKQTATHQELKAIYGRLMTLVHDAAKAMDQMEVGA